MIAYINGKVADYASDYVVIDNNGIGYYINYMHPQTLKLNETVTIYTYQHFREDATLLYGFASKEEQRIFNKLIAVKGLGPKTALQMLSCCSVEEMINAIENGNIAFLKSMPSVGAKTAQQIILDLKGKLVEDNNNNIVNSKLEEAILGLKALGYKNNEINEIVKTLSKKDLATSDAYLKEGLKMLLALKGGK